MEKPQLNATLIEIVQYPSLGLQIGPSQQLLQKLERQRPLQSDFIGDDLTEENWDDIGV